MKRWDNLSTFFTSFQIPLPPPGCIFVNANSEVLESSAALWEWSISHLMKGEKVLCHVRGSKSIWITFALEESPLWLVTPDTIEIALEYANCSFLCWKVVSYVLFLHAYFLYLRIRLFLCTRRYIIHSCVTDCSPPQLFIPEKCFTQRHRKHSSCLFLQPRERDRTAEKLQRIAPRTSWENFYSPRIMYKFNGHRQLGSARQQIQQ